jgi:hypothetical protein
MLLTSAHETRGEVEAVRAIAMVGVRGDGVLVLVEARVRAGTGDGVLVTVMRS